MKRKKILFLTILKIDSIYDRGLYNDLLKQFVKNNHELYVICPNERRNKEKSKISFSKKINILQVKTLNFQKTNLIEKGIALLSIEYLFLRAIKKYFNDVKFDLIIYSTPPITFTKIIYYIKKINNSYSYLLLKDIFPQNAIDMNLIKKNGLVHKFFRAKEKELYKLSDKIGCMSNANLEYIKKNNPELNHNKLEINPNSIDPIFINHSNSQKRNIKLKYEIPTDKKIFLYGGNLGKPQGLEFLLETILKNRRSDVFFLIVGNGTEYKKIKKWFKIHLPSNAKLISFLPKNEYDMLIGACDVGLIFLSKNFTIPNYPSRLLSYLEMKMPIISATDKCTDVGYDIEKNKCGYSVISGDIEEMNNAIDSLLNNVESWETMRNNAWSFIQREFKSERSYNIVMRSLNEK